MRLEILKYLSDSNEFKPLNEFIKSISKGKDIDAIALTLREMYDTYRLLDRKENVIELKGDFDYLGKTFIYIDDKVRPKFKTHVIAMGIPAAGHDKVLGDIMVGDLDNCLFEGMINFRGRKELEDHELNQSIKMVNDSVRKTNKLTAWVAILAGVFSLTSLFISLITIGKSSQVQVEELKETNKILQTQVKSLQDFLFDLDRKHLIPARKDSLSE